MFCKEENCTCGSPFRAYLLGGLKGILDIVGNVFFDDSLGGLMFNNFVVLALAYYMVINVMTPCKDGSRKIALKLTLAMLGSLSIYVLGKFLEMGGVIHR
jgi:hypothetical protein